MKDQFHWHDYLVTAIAPAIWGSTYYVTSEYLPSGYPITFAVLRALPAGILLLLFVRHLPPIDWIGRVFILGALNFSIFWSLLFVTAYTLPGGVAATLGAFQALAVVILSRWVLGTRIAAMNILAAVGGVAGIGMMVLGPSAGLSTIGIAAGLGGALSMAAGTVLSRRWQPPVSPVTFTAWQLTAGGVLLVPLAIYMEPALPEMSPSIVSGIIYLGLIGAAATYYLWFRGVARIAPSAIALLGFLSPLTAILLGWLALDQQLSPVQIAGAIIILGSIWVGQRASRN